MFITFWVRSSGRQTGNTQAVFLQCTTNYPSRIEDSNIRAIVSIGDALNALVGYSDHTQSDYSALAAVALGAVVVEKHFTLDKRYPGPDHSSSITPGEMSTLIHGIRGVEASLGSTEKFPTEAERKNMVGMRRSIVAVEHIPAGVTIVRSQLDFKRPATGLEPKRLFDVIGKRGKVDIQADTLLTSDSIEW